MGEIKKQSINNSVLSYIGAALGMLSIYIQPQLISASDIGLLRLLFSFSWMAAVVMPFGVGSITLRYFPKIKNDENGHHGFFSLLLLLATAGALIVAMLLLYNADFFTTYYQNSAEFPKYFNEAIIFAYVLSLLSVYSIYSASQFKTSFTVFLTDIFSRVGALLVVVLYHYNLLTKQGLVWSYILVFFIQLILLFLYLWRAGAISFKINFKFYKTLPLKEIGVFGLLMMMTAFASLGIKFIDQLMIGHFMNAEMVGIYATCVMMSVVMEIPFNSLERIASPKISYAWSISDKAEVAKIYEMSSRYMFFAGAVLFCLLWSSIDLILQFLPPKYSVGRISFYIVSFSSLVNLLTGVNSSVILYSHKYFVASLFLFVLIAVGFLANYLLIPLYGLNGAALATLIAIGTFNLLKYLYILIRFKMQPFSKHSFAILVTGLLALLPVLLLPADVHPFLKALIGGFSTLVFFSLLNIKMEVIHEVNKVFKRFGIIKTTKQN
jgi:O-antigen/teichoic acid export membrane protein